MSTPGERVVAIRLRKVDVNEVNNKATLFPRANKTVWTMVGDQRAETAVEQLVETVLQEEDDACGGETEMLSIGEGNEKVMYVALGETLTRTEDRFD